jgi:hypothetical protein
MFTDRIGVRRTTQADAATARGAGQTRSGRALPGTDVPLLVGETAAGTTAARRAGTASSSLHRCRMFEMTQDLFEQSVTRFRCSARRRNRSTSSCLSERCSSAKSSSMRASQFGERLRSQHLDGRREFAHVASDSNVCPHETTSY